MVALQYTIASHTMTGSFTCNRFDHFPGFSVNVAFSWSRDCPIMSVEFGAETAKTAGVTVRDSPGRSFNFVASTI